jgi:hypothetical protein
VITSSRACGMSLADAEHVDRLVAERADEVVDGARKAAHATGETPARRLPDARRVEGDRLDAGAVERPLERLPHLDVAADAHDEQQRPPLAADGGAKAYPVDLDEVDAPVTRRGRARLVTP